MHLAVHLSIAGVLLLILIALFMYRRFIDVHDDHNIHLHNDQVDSQIISTQVEHAKRIEMLDRLNKYLGIAVSLYIIAIIAMAIYSAWMNPGTM